MCEGLHELGVRHGGHNDGESAHERRLEELVHVEDAAGAGHGHEDGDGVGHHPAMPGTRWCVELAA